MVFQLLIRTFAPTMNIRILAIDDEPLALQQLVNYISKVPYLQLVAQCESAIEAIEVLNSEPIDALFCDINMPDLNGMDFVKQLNVPPLIVFTTAYSEYALEGFRVNAVDYLLKPFGLQDFLRAAERVKERFLAKTGTETAISLNTPATNSPQPAPAATENDVIFVKTDYRVVKVAFNDIRYVEGMSEYLKLHLDSQPKPIVTLLAMKTLEERLPGNFMRIHRSYIVNLDKIQEVNKNRVILCTPPREQSIQQENKDNVYLPIGESYKEAFNHYIEVKFLGK